MKELLTLSKFVDKVYGWGSNVTYSGCYHSIKEYNSFLKGPVQLFHFIPCKDGKPLEKPDFSDGSCGVKEFACEPNSDCPCSQEIAAIEKAYQQAQDAVIFEGWELDMGDNPEYIYLQHEDYLLSGFHCISNSANISIIDFVDFVGGGQPKQNINTYSDLAEATQGNTLKMRK